MAILITTTGIQSTITFNDLGGRSFSHPIVDYDISSEYELEELRDSGDFQNAIDQGWITVEDENSISITDVSNLDDRESEAGDIDKNDVGLGNVPNVDATDRANHTGTQTASTISDFDTEVSNNSEVSQNTTHRGLTNNPHSVTKGQVGLSNVENISTTNDRAMVELSTTTVITTTTNSPVNGLTYTTKNLGGNGTYLISTSLSRSHNISDVDTRVSIEVGGTVVKEFRTASFANEIHIIAFSVVVQNIASGTIIRVLSRTGGGTHTIIERSLTVDGILDGRVAT